ncbi:MFS transporter [Flavobacterium nackdongense]|uniref:MFS transporter n=1 Tax=Flavobacterium nackdongense TaxID=2547394 RepID=A0A4P6YIH0_9FLAO|nr:MFS transporter [Flavobacterium nackdongense]QBN20390.1 MFS transporter [Flavobacterium nackdongense]
MKIKGMRWWIIVLLFVAAVLNYIDRQTLSALAPTIQADLEMDDQAYANVINIFLIAYTIAYLISGRVADKIGTRASLFIFVAWWSVFNMLTAAARGVTSLSFYRFGLGLGEAGIWPAASKAVSEWFPAKERALAIGLYTMGATIGATVAPYIVIPLATYNYSLVAPAIAHALGQGTGWRVAFILTGVAGLLWLIPWLLIYRRPEKSKLITSAELTMLQTDSVAEQGKSTENVDPWSWKQVLSFRGTWLLLIARLITDPVWYFYQFWFPKYLSADRDLSQDQLKITWIVYAAAGIGSLLGGIISGKIVKKGVLPVASRMWVMLGCAILMPLSPFIASATGLNASLTLTVFTVIAALAWLINISSLIVDIVPKHSLGTVFSVVAAGSTLGGIVMNMIVAAMVTGPSDKPAGFLDSAFHVVLDPILNAVQGQGYAMWFLIMAFLHPLAWLLLKFGGIYRYSTAK